jgi:hypothetical protein
MGTGAKGTISNPYTMAEFEELADAGLWQGGRRSNRKLFRIYSSF